MRDRRRPADRRCPPVRVAAWIEASTRMTQRYDRRRDEVSLDEVEPIVI